MRWLSALPAFCAQLVARPAGKRARLAAQWRDIFFTVRAACGYVNAPAMLRDVLDAVEPPRPRRAEARVPTRRCALPPGGRHTMRAGDPPLNILQRMGDSRLRFPPSSSQTLQQALSRRRVR